MKEEHNLTEAIVHTEAEAEPSEEWLQIKGEAEKMHLLIKEFNEQAMETLYSCRQQNVSSDVAI